MIEYEFSMKKKEKKEDAYILSFNLQQNLSAHFDQSKLGTVDAEIKVRSDENPKLSKVPS